jgi:hypothetical protein
MIEAAVIIRRALPSERSGLEALQWRASLANPGHCDTILLIHGGIQFRNRWFRCNATK